MQTTCARKHNELIQDSYLAATLAGAFSPALPYWRIYGQIQETWRILKALAYKYLVW